MLGQLKRKALLRALQYHIVPFLLIIGASRPVTLLSDIDLSVGVRGSLTMQSSAST